MKRSSIFAAAGTFVLLVAGILASKANKKFSGATSVYYKNTVTNQVVTAFTGSTSSTDELVTTGTGNGVAYFVYGSNKFAMCTSTGATLLHAF
jgi:hypothetical protein